jgi:hypothetical protein
MIAMKGIFASVWLYEAPGLRQFSDIDLLVREEDASAVLAILARAGYRTYKGNENEFISQNRESSHYPPMILNGVSVEVHTRVHKKKSAWKVDHAALWSQSKEIVLHGAKVRVFSLTDQLITISLHLQKHFESGSFQFTGFYDIVRILDKYHDEIDWKEFKSKCENWNTESIYDMLCLANHYFDAKLPEFLENYKAEARLYDIFEDCILYGSSSRNTGFQAVEKLKYVDGRFNKIRFLLYYLIPPPSYMHYHYKTSDKRRLLYLYPVRWWLAFKGLLAVLKK